MREFIFALLVDVLLFALNIALAILQRGTWIGWLCTAFVIWQAFTFAKFVRSI
jgi:hypothetical protein